MCSLIFGLQSSYGLCLDLVFQALAPPTILAGACSPGSHQSQFQPLTSWISTSFSSLGGDIPNTTVRSQQPRAGDKPYTETQSEHLRNSASDLEGAAQPATQPKVTR